MKDKQSHAFNALLYGKPGVLLQNDKSTIESLPKERNTETKLKSQNNYAEGGVLNYPKQSRSKSWLVGHHRRESLMVLSTKLSGKIPLQRQISALIQVSH